MEGDEKKEKRRVGGQKGQCHMDKNLEKRNWNEKEELRRRKRTSAGNGKEM